MHFSFTTERVLSAAVRLDVFSHIASGKHTVAEIAAAASSSERGMRMLLDALAAFELLTKEDGRYDLTPDARQYLVRSSPEYLGAFLESNMLWESWSNLADVVREGKPPRSSSRQEVAEEFFPILIRSLHVTNSAPAARLAEQIASPGAKSGLSVLDIGCGSAVWSIAIAKADPAARVTAFDYPKVLETTREFTTREGVAGRYDYLPGDLRVAEFPQGRFDVAILGNIVHGEGETVARDLFQRIHRALAPGGRLVILDMIPNDERTGPIFPLLFALNMLVATDQGDTYTMAQYRDWLAGAGYGRIETLDVASHSPAVVATKA
jgi:SAM-dependent methyltransferase